jgi:hemolysin III
MVRIEGFPILTGTLYIVLGWTAVLLLPQFVHDLSPVALALLGAGGVLYTCGSIVLLKRRPDPAPATFGYHEVWHSMVIGASACHYGAVLLILLPGR